ncbi:MAG: HEAT repeat domain-containing protein [Planctomycetota bacterium]
MKIQARIPRERSRAGRRVALILALGLAAFAWPDASGLDGVELGGLHAQVAVPTPGGVSPLPSTSGPDRPADPRDRGSRDGSRNAGGGYQPGGTGTASPFSPGGTGTAKGDGPGGGGSTGGGGQNGGPGGVGTPGGGAGGNTGVGGGVGGGSPGGAGGLGGGQNGGGSPLPGPAPVPGGRTRGSESVDDDWTLWWRINELHELALDERYRDRTLQAEPDRDLFLGGEHRGRAQLITGGSERALKKAMPALQVLARHETARVRAEAVLAMGKVGGDGVVTSIAPFVKDGNLDVRKHAILGLGLTQSSRAFPHRRLVLKDPSANDAEHAFAAIALGLLGDERGVEVLREVIEKRSRPQEVRAAALYALGHIGTNAARVYLEYFVLRPLEDDLLRSAALQGLAASGRADTSRTFENLLLDANVHVRRSAAIALGQVSFATPYRAQLAAMEKDFETGRDDGAGVISPRAREEADAYLGGLRLKVEKEERRLEMLRDETVRALVRAIRDDSDVMVRNFALLSLGRLGGPVARKALEENLDGAAIQSMKAFSALGMGLAKDEELSSSLRDALERGRLAPDTRGAVAIALGLADERQAGKLLLKQLRSSGDTEAIRGAAIGLGLIAERDAAELLMDLAKSKSRPELKREVGIALGLLGDERALEAFAARLKRSSVSSRVAAAEALAGFPDERALDVVVGVLDQPGIKDSVEAACARAIGVLAEKGDTPVSSDFFRHLNYLMRFRALNEAAVL